MDRVRRVVGDVVAGWRSGTQRSQQLVLAALVVGVMLTMAVSLARYALFPIAGFFLWLVLGLLLLRFRELVVLSVLVVAAGVASRVQQGDGVGRVSGVVLLLLAALLVLYASSRQRSGLPGPLSSALLADLRDRLNAQGRVPPLPGPWTCETAMVAAHGVGYAGDFMVADLDVETQRLDLVLVDVVGKGVKAAPSALLLAGALGGLVGALRGPALFEAANDFLLRQDERYTEETFATAVHVSVDLTDGAYTILSAGHPPALRWEPDAGTWIVDNARGLALGVLPHPDLEASTGVLQPGQALLFYTDGVVESRGNDIEDGIGWLQETAAAAYLKGSDGAARRVLRQVPRGDDDRAVLLLSRAT
ncbi:PP2C family protein-serine/threonine phosphatase [Nocardioides sp.]|uniref:PP2C family protein-serine/threonine phosphatase n=1 Tax=Nocardioides sp. TaxID=35761 RepID=UPI002717173A|nr:PP2C family protein-serine/threonine phosphatase [Nocardioides sp.]MDO9457017.1 PP2C family protein-serine/threonine phosphatase [Nocardioides sp.]